MKQSSKNVGLVSVGLPTFNRPDALRRSLGFITSQTYKNLEIIISDNASSDSGVNEVIQEFLVDPRVKYYKQKKNIGLVANAEFVLRNARGEYFTWIADDDWRDTKFIESLVCALECNKKIGFAFCDYYEVLENGNRAPGYPGTHVTTFKPFESKSRLLRIISFYWQDSSKGKCNLYYSLFRREMIGELDIKKISDDFNHLDVDCLIVFTMLQRSPAVIVNQPMCTLTVGNVKHYICRKAMKGDYKLAVFKRIYGYWIAGARERRLYVKNTEKKIEKLIINLLLGPKFFLFIVKSVAKKLLNN